MNCAIYARVSTRDKGQDFTNQLLALREFAAKQGWAIVNEYIDQQSAKDDDREQFQQLFKDASQRRFDVLLFWSLARLSREGVLETLQHLQRLTSYGIAWRSFTEQYLDSTGIFREAVIGILAAIAKQERVTPAERTLLGLAWSVSGARVSAWDGQWRKWMQPRSGRYVSRANHGPRFLGALAGLGQRFRGLQPSWQRRRRLVSEDQMTALRTPRNILA
jgi:Resolvase, N terminal domain